MFAIPGILLLLTFIYLRPQEFITPLRALPLLYLFLGLAIFGYAVDLRLRRTKPFATPQIGWMVLFFAWCVFSIALRVPANILGVAIDLAIPAALYLLIAHGVQSFRAFQALAGTVVALILFLSFVGVEQGMSPSGCFVINQSTGDSGGIYDGRPCNTYRECEKEGAEPGTEYMCEKVGLFGTSSIGGRVRYLGKLQDPNELAMVITWGCRSPLRSSSANALRCARCWRWGRLRWRRPARCIRSRAAASSCS